MFSTVVASTGLKGLALRQLRNLAVIQCRTCSNLPSAPPKATVKKADDPVISQIFPKEAPKNENEVEYFDVAKQWAWANDVLYGKDRDMVNFPPPDIHNKPPVRHRFIPESLFQFMYDKTGVTGPYVLGVGGFLSAISTGLIVVGPHTMDLLIWGSVVSYIMIRSKALKTFSAYVKRARERENSLVWHEPINEFKKQCEDGIQKGGESIVLLDARGDIFDIQRENVGLMLENEYRGRLDRVHTEVKRRLDYQLAVETTERNFEQEHMVNWIRDSVVKSITPDLEKQNLTSCIQQLKSLSKTAQL